MSENGQGQFDGISPDEEQSCFFRLDHYVLKPFLVYKYDRLKCRRDDDNVEFMAQFGNVLGSIAGDEDDLRTDENM